MKLSEFKQNLAHKIDVLFASMVFTFKQETTYWANNWGNIFSTSIYMLSSILFIEIIYANVNTVAGYSKDQMLLFTMIGEFAFFLNWIFYSNLHDLIIMVNKGTLDFILIRPISSLFYVTFRKIPTFSIIRDAIPPLIVIAIVINWSHLNIIPINFFIGFVILFLGLTSAHVIHFLAAISVFWLGESSNILDFSTHVEYNVGKIIPYEGFPHKVQMFFTTAIPFLISAALSTSVVLGKSDPYKSLYLGVIVTLIMLFVRSKLWNIALKVYTSASS